MTKLISLLSKLGTSSSEPTLGNASVVIHPRREPKLVAGERKTLRVHVKLKHATGRVRMVMRLLTDSLAEECHEAVELHPESEISSQAILYVIRLCDRKLTSFYQLDEKSLCSA